MKSALYAFAVSLALATGCATTAQLPDNEAEVAIMQQEDVTLARLQTSNSRDIADAAGAMARGRAR